MLTRAYMTKEPARVETASITSFLHLLCIVATTVK
jgi:hypothetical protein